MFGKEIENALFGEGKKDLSEVSKADFKLTDDEDAYKSIKKLNEEVIDQLTEARRGLITDNTEEKECYKIYVEVPGLSEEDINLSYTTEDINLSYMERRQFVDISISVSEVEPIAEGLSKFGLPNHNISYRYSWDEIDPDLISASLKKGILEITIPKRTASKPNKSSEKNIKID